MLVCSVKLEAKISLRKPDFELDHFEKKSFLVDLITIDL